MMQKTVIVVTALLGVACVAMFFVMWQNGEQPPPTSNSECQTFVVLHLDASPKARLGALTPLGDGFVVGNGRGELLVFPDLKPDAKPRIYSLSKNPIVAPVLVKDEVCFVGDTNGRFFAFDPATGEKWSYKTGNQITGSAIWCDGMVIVGSHDGTLYALDPETGALKYSVDCDGQINGSPLFLESQHALVFGSCDGLLRKIDVRTGTILAEINFEHYLPETPALFDGVLYLLTRNFDEPEEDDDNDSDGENQGVLAAIDADSFELLWRVPTRDMYSSTPYATHDFLFLTTYFKGKINVHSRKDGQFLTTLDTDEKMTTLQAGDDSRVYAVSRLGKLYQWQREGLQAASLPEELQVALLPEGLQVTLLPNNRWNRTQLADLQTDCIRACLLLGNKLIVADDNGGLFYYTLSE